MDESNAAQNPEVETPKAGREQPEVTTKPKQPQKGGDPSLKAEKPYAVRMWAGKIPVYVCKKCGRQMDDQDRMILHVIGHYPQDQREQLLDELVKEGK